MSSLQCPARVFVARHGEAEYETDLVTDDGGCLTPQGRAQARALADRLRGERIARVWTSSLSRAVQTAEIVAARLDVDVVVREGLREYGVGAIAGTHADERAHVGAAFDAWVEGDRDATIGGGERIDAFVGRVTTVLEEVADEHRGETALVVSHGGAILAALPPLVGIAAERVRGLSLPNCAAVELEADAEGWRLTTWDGRRDIG
ncbi:histidine phosphatase family protein [Nocardioides sp. MAHUQ-72]|uniref:histidine phosphatase family protein n=1 Tax=unclassified Nocardioides TaxID=2615069 RepID=UPI0036219BF2